MMTSETSVILTSLPAETHITSEGNEHTGIAKEVQALDKQQ